MRRAVPLLVALGLLLSTAALAASASPPRLLRQPTLSAEAIVFSYGGDLWGVARAGGTAVRLTSGPGFERDAVFSPDGRSIAFSGEYDGNVDLFVISAAGGEPRRLTWHPGADRPVGWTRDGSQVVFRSVRDNGTGDERLWTIPAQGGWPERLPLPEAFAGSFSPDGQRFAYMPHERFQLSWKRYRGGEATFVWIVDLKSLDVELVPRGNSNDSYPSWAEDGRVYFLSDREGTVTLFRYDPASRAVARVFANDGLDLKNAQAGPGAVIFERFGEIGLYDLASGRVTFPPIAVEAELPTTRPRFAKAGEGISGAALSPTGARAAFSVRGEIVTVPAEKGDPRSITRSAGAADRDPTWSPDGQTLAWLSDESGEYALHLAPQSGLGEVRRIALGEPPSFFYRPLFSPDGKRIALHDKRLNLWVVEVASGARTQVDSDLFDHPARSLDPAWSPDGRFLAYTKRLPTQIHALFLYDLETKRAQQVSDGLADVRFPAFDASGKFLWFTASTDLGPTAPWLDMTSVERPVTRSLWLAVLEAKEPSPLAPESDEEKAEGDQKDDEKKAAAKDAAKPTEKGKAAEKGKPAEKADEKSEEKPVTRIDFDGLSRRFVAVAQVDAKSWQRLLAGKKGEVFLHASPGVADADSDGPGSGAGALWKFVLDKREATKLADAVDEVLISKDGEKLLLRSGESWSIAASGAPVEAGKGKLALDAVEVRVEPREEWRQIYREAWRLTRDFLYDPSAHGLDLARAAARYEPYLAGLSTREDLNYLMVEMLGNTSLGHTYIARGDLPTAPAVKGGLLGADWEIAGGRYRLAKVYSGESWNPELEAPLSRPGVDARAGEYLIAVEGREIAPPQSVYAPFEATAGKRVRLRLGPDPSGKGAREVTVIPVASEQGLRYRDWVEGNRREVERLSGGRLGYLHLPNTAGAGFDSFNRYFFPQIDRQGLVVDERNNGGGLVADYIVEILGRQQMWSVVTREGREMPSPAGALYGPKAMLINRHAGSGGDALPWMFRHRQLGPLVGTRTWGGLVGVWDYPPLVDGGFVSAPRGGLYTIHGKWEVENVGVAPDFEVEIAPRDFAAGRDPQLAKAVELLLAELDKNPRRPPSRPPFPNYQTTPWQSEAKP